MYINMIYLISPLQFPQELSQSTDKIGAFYLPSSSQSIVFIDPEVKKLTGGLLLSSPYTHEYKKICLCRFFFSF